MQPGGWCDQLTGRRRLQPVADLQQAGTDDRLVGHVLDVDHPGERHRERLHRRDRADQPLAGALDDRGVDRDPVVAQLDDRARRARQLVHLVLGQLLAVQRQLPLEAEQGLRSEEPVLQRLLADPDAPALPAELDALGDLAVEVLRPHDRVPRLGQRRRPAVEQRQDLVGVEHDLVGDPEVEQPVEHRPGVGGGPQRDGCMGARALAEAVRRLGTGIGPELGGIGHVGRVVDRVHLEHQSYGAGHELLLVGLDPERDGHQLRSVVATPRADPGDALLELVAEVVGRRRAGWRPAGRGLPPEARPSGRGARHRVDDRVEQAADHALGSGRVEPVVRPRAREVGDPLLVGRAEAGHLPVPTLGVGGEATGGHQLQAHQRGAGEQRDRRVEVVLVAHLAEHRQRPADRHDDRAAGVGELDRALPGRLPHQQPGGTGDRDKTHAVASRRTCNRDGNAPHRRSVPDD